MHISDIHVSKYLKRRGHIQHLHSFIQNELSLVNPSLVVVTGDLTDAKTKNKLNSHQYSEEWVAYKKVLEMGKVEERRGSRFWFDQVYSIFLTLRGEIMTASTVTSKTLSFQIILLQSLRITRIH
jgi:predicted MPP superfamily phosphohydrolase